MQGNIDLVHDNVYLVEGNINLVHNNVYLVDGTIHTQIWCRLQKKDYLRIGENKLDSGFLQGGHIYTT